MKERLKEWLKRYKVSAHAINGAIASAVGVYVGVPQVKDLVDGYLSSHKSLAAVVAAGIAIVLKYSNSGKPTPVS